MEADNDLLVEFKSKMRIFHSAEDDNLKSILESAVQFVNDMVGGPDYKIHPRKKSLILNRARYDYNGMLEFFDGNFQHEILNLSIEFQGWEG